MECIMIQKNGDKFFTPLDPARLFSRERDAKGHHITLTLKKESSTQFRDRRDLDELITIWYRMHGKTLRDHVRLRKLLYRVSERLGNPIGSELTNEQFAIYREQRTTEVSTSTINREHAYLRAMFNELDRLGVIEFENPLIKIRKFKEREGELRYLTHDEIDTLLDVCRVSTNRSLQHIVKICLATGARWSEAENLKPTQIQNNQITFLNTKSGKNRTVPVSDKLFNELVSIKPVNDMRIFLSSLSAFRKAVSKSQIQLPRGQMSHVLRHSFASHFVMKGGNIVVLKDILGHSEITTTMRYAHLAPNHLTEAVRLNPLNDHY